MKAYKFLPILFLILLFAGCTKEPDVQEITNQIIITYPDGKSVSSDGSIEIYIENTSKECIAYPIDFGFTIFAQKGGQTIEFENGVEYSGKGPIILQPYGEIIWYTSTSFLPKISEEKKMEFSSFYSNISGHLCDDDSVIITKTIPFEMNP